MREHRAAKAFLPALLAAMLAAAVAAGAAEASPEWHFNSTLLPYQSQEAVKAKAAEASLGFFGMTTTCKPVTLELEVENLLGGPGVGQVTGASLGSCTVDPSFCTVDATLAEDLPWPVHLTTIGGEHYFVIEGIKISILYGGMLCALWGLEMPVEGTAGGLVDDSAHTVTFDSTTMSTVGAQLEVFGQPIEFEGTFGWLPTGGASSPLTVL